MATISMKFFAEEINCLVYGYTREYLQIDLVGICFHYYFDQNNLHEWDSKFIASCFQIDNHCLKPLIRGGATALLKQIVDSGSHHWRFKIKQLRPENCAWSLIFGIVNFKQIETLDVKDNAFLLPDTYGYVANLGIILAGNSTPNVMRCKTGDIVDMYLDIENHKLKYYVNGNKLGIMVKDISGLYRIAVYMRNYDCIELLSTVKSINFQ
eukprot:440142_1